MRFRWWSFLECGRWRWFLAAQRGFLFWRGGFQGLRDWCWWVNGRRLGTFSCWWYGISTGLVKAQHLFDARETIKLHVSRQLSKQWLAQIKKKQRQEIQNLSTYVSIYCLSTHSVSYQSLPKPTNYHSKPMCMIWFPHYGLKAILPTDRCLHCKFLVPQFQILLLMNLQHSWKKCTKFLLILLFRLY